MRSLDTHTRGAKRSSRLSVPRERNARYLLEDLANAQDDLKHFRQRWPGYYRSFRREDILRWRDELRLLWRYRFAKVIDFSKGAPAPLEISDRVKALHDAWARRFPDRSLERYICEHWLLSEARNGLVVDWEGSNRRIRANPVSLPAALAFTCVRLGERLGYCLNEDCSSRYFLRVRRDQKYCSPECAKPAKRAAKLRWWNANRASILSRRKKLRRGKKRG